MLIFCTCPLSALALFKRHWDDGDAHCAPWIRRSTDWMWNCPDGQVGHWVTETGRNSPAYVPKIGGSQHYYFWIRKVMIKNGLWKNRCFWGIMWVGFCRAHRYTYPMISMICILCTVLYYMSCELPCEWDWVSSCVFPYQSRKKQLAAPYHTSAWNWSHETTIPF